MTRIKLDVGFPLVCSVIRQAVDELRLKRQDKIVAVIKAPAVRLIPRRS